ncbi:MAG TPA: 50S ribosomal protein L17, partial [Geobacteraceae bacterium]|nr:50S ribosomal protein L17 [Geobacteraceae bacterium]
YTRIIKLGVRPGDNALLSRIELVEEEMEKKPVKKAAKKSSAGAAAKAKVPRAPRKPKKVEEPAVEETKDAAETTEQE